MNTNLFVNSTIYDYHSRDEVQMESVLDFIEKNSAIVEESSWKDADTDWPEADREGRKVVTITPTRNGYRDDVSQWVVVVD